MNFSYDQYAETVNRAKNGGTNTNSVKVGWFKLGTNQEAIVRFNVAELKDLQFANVHTIKTKSGKWMRVSCLNHIGQYEDNCELCHLVDQNRDVSKAAKRVYVQMLVSYKDAATGGWTEAQPVIWERPAGFSTELGTLIKDYGSLKENLFKITRTGAGLDTRYSVNLAAPNVFKASMVPADFSAFANFNIAKHSYWEKTAEEIAVFVATGEFPEAPKAEKSDNMVTRPDGIKVGGAPVFDTPAEEAAADAALNPVPAPEVTPAPVAQPAPAAAPAPEQPARNFNQGFKF